MSKHQHLKVTNKKAIKIKDQNGKEHDAEIVTVDAPKDTRPDMPDIGESEGVDYLAVAEVFLKAKDKQPETTVEGETLSIQVMDGNRNLGDFSAKGGDSIKELQDYIETNDLQEVRPWSVAYDLICALKAYGEAHK